MNVEKVTEKYYENNAEKLHKMVDSIIKKFGGLSNKDYDDFYSLANEVFCIAARDFNGTGNFNGFLYSRLVLKIRSLITKRNRNKRANIETIVHDDGRIERIFHQPLSLDSPIKGRNGEMATYGDIIESNFDVLDEISKEIGLSFSSDVQNYLEQLPNKTRKIAMLLSEGYKPCDIMDKLHIDNREYGIHIDIIKDYKYTKIIGRRFIK